MVCLLSRHPTPPPRASSTALSMLAMSMLATGTVVPRVGGVPTTPPPTLLVAAVVAAAAVVIVGARRAVSSRGPEEGFLGLGFGLLRVLGFYKVLRA